MISRESLENLVQSLVLNISWNWIESNVSILLNSFFLFFAFLYVCIYMYFIFVFGIF